MDKAIEVSNLRKRYQDVVALDGISFDVRKGEIFVIVGPNGAGKTTSVEICEGLRKADGGTVTILGFDPSDDEMKQRIGAQLEESQFDRDIKVKEIFQFYRSFYRKKKEVREILDRLDLHDQRDIKYSKLSKGLKQRVSIGVALINDPDILFFDEISSGLDPEARRNIWDFLHRIRKENKTIIFTTHYMDEAKYLGDRVLIINRGRVAALDSPANLLKQFISSHKIEYRGAPAGDIPGVKGVKSLTGKTILYTDRPKEVMARLKKMKITDAMTDSVNLEDVYFHFTGK